MQPMAAVQYMANSQPYHRICIDDYERDFFAASYASAEMVF